MTRKLVVFPIVHTPQDMGSLRSSISTGHTRDVEEFTRDFWLRLVGMITKIVSHIDPIHLQIYQDGLPVGGELGEAIIRESAESGSANHRLILSLLKKGATLEATESPSLLKQEYEIIKMIYSETNGQKRAQLEERYQIQLKSIAEDRDRKIAENINASLKQGNFGFLFIGAAHFVNPFLSSDISVFTNDGDSEHILRWLSAT